MKRIPITPRADWRQRVESQGLLFHTIEEELYWDESAYYLFTRREIDEIERASYTLQELCLQAIERVVKENLWDRFCIPPQFRPWIAASWERDEVSIYGRFDLVYDGQRPPALLEYNADTPTAVLEASVIQWFWMKDLADHPERPSMSVDQFNSIHERLIEAWRRFGTLGSKVVHFSCVGAHSLEDMMTVEYLRDVAVQAGIETTPLDMKDVGWNAGTRTFRDLLDKPIAAMFKLYPWEWMLREAFGRNLPMSNVRWLEPPWKMLLSNKALLPTLYEMFPESPYLLKADVDPIGSTYVRKPIFSREGANVALIHNDQIVLETEGSYGDEPVVYQEFRPLPKFEGNHPVIGSWMIDGSAAGVGIREDRSLITTNTSRFVPHVFQ